MDGRAFDRISNLPREDLEDFVVRAAIETRRAKAEARAGDRFVSVITGFMLGVAVVGSAVVLGTLLG